MFSVVQSIQINTERRGLSHLNVTIGEGVQLVAICNKRNTRCHQILHTVICLFISVYVQICFWGICDNAVRK